MSIAFAFFSCEMDSLLNLSGMLRIDIILFIIYYSIRRQSASGGAE